MNKAKHIFPPQLFLILGIGLIVRILLNHTTTAADETSFVLWARYLTEHRLVDLYDFLPGGYLTYPPVYYYVLWVMGWAGNISSVWQNEWLSYLLVKLPVFASEIAGTLLTYRVTKKMFGEKSALWGSAFFFLHPAVIYTTSVWGQIDSVITCLSLASIIALFNKRLKLGWLLFILGVLIKLQMLAVFPILLVLTWREKKKLFELWWTPLAVLVALLPLLVPKGIGWTLKYFASFPNQYPYTSVYAYNLWSPLGFIVGDKLKLFSLIEVRLVGIVLLLAAALFIVWPLRRNKINLPELLFAGFLLYFAFAFFPTRIHSRYLVYSLGFIAPFVLRYPILSLGVSILMIVNLLLPNHQLEIESLVKFLNQPITIWVMMLFGLGLFIYAMRLYAYKILKVTA